jgi:hypothetical protein
MTVRVAERLQNFCLVVQLCHSERSRGISGYKFLIMGRDYNFWIYADYTKLIYYEWYRDIRDAIARESQLKKWSRAKKMALINRLNPTWRDLDADVLQDRQFQQISRLRSK